MTVEWVAVDWGTTNLRLWVFGQRDVLLGTANSDHGMGNLKPGEFESVLLELLNEYLPASGQIQVMCCGMVGARQGWLEAGYSSVPCVPPGAADAVKPPVVDPRLMVQILPGVRQNSPADVMRGEETQIGGYLADNPDFDGVICLPGTHTKWAHVSAGEIVSFRTFMTGELFSLLAKQSVLRFGISDGGWNDESFATAVNDAISRPQNIAGDLFSLRASGLLHDMKSADAISRLSGLLIGLELAAARPYWLGRRIVLIGAPELAKNYLTALSGQGVVPETTNSADITLAGLRSAYHAVRRINS
jgi:2-dehydro-3-deoxygalactonokinase